MNGINAATQSIRTNINSFVCHPAVQTTKKLVYGATLEIVSVTASSIFLKEVVAKRMLIPIAPDAMKAAIFTGVVLAPIVEEILFRQLLQGFLHMLQKFKNRFIAKEAPNPQNLKAQEIFRVRVTAVLFGCVHLLNPHTHVIFAAIQFTSATLGGLCYGYLSEKYNTISLTILAHGMHNALLCGAVCYGHKGKGVKAVLLLIAVIAQKKFWFTFGCSDVIQNKFNTITKSVKCYVANTADHISKRINPPIPIGVEAI
ncbi:MAG: CPBP family intramembrane metalloprotease [Parachlamydiaceae bacterium]|nr:CPBP family intramembrane metalloprotease [Parachlamydiaceae bacterium]